MLIEAVRTAEEDKKATVFTDLEAKGFSKPQNCILDNSKLKSLGWSGQYTLEKGLLECYWILKQKQ